MRPPISSIVSHLGVAQIGDGVEGYVAHRPPAPQAGRGRKREDDELVFDREIDDPVDHVNPSCPRRRASSRPHPTRCASRTL